MLASPERIPDCHPGYVYGIEDNFVSNVAFLYTANNSEDLHPNSLISSEYTDQLVSLFEGSEDRVFETHDLRETSSAQVESALRKLVVGEEYTGLGVFYFRCPLIRDADGTLFLGCAGTRVEDLEETAIELDTLINWQQQSSFKYVVAIFDTVVFSVDAKSADTDVLFPPLPPGTVLYAAGVGVHVTVETGEIRKQPGSGLGANLLTALRDGKADADHNGLITVSELDSYLFTHSVEDKRAFKPLCLASQVATGEDLFINQCYDKTRAQPKCFVIAPPNSARAREVYERYAAPACETAGLDPSFVAGKSNGNGVSALQDSLVNAPTAVAYLGRPNPEWDANVMMSVGYRLATGLPLVLLREQPAPGDQEMPFSTSKKQLITLLDGMEELEHRDDGEAEATEELKTMRAEIARALSEKPRQKWQTPHAVASIRFEIEEKKAIFTSSSLEADLLFDRQHSTLVNENVSEALSKLESLMVPEQIDAFSFAQHQLITQIISSHEDGRKFVPETCYPIVFKDHPLTQFSDSSYLPIVVHLATTKNTVDLEILYLDITGATTVDDNGVHKADFVPLIPRRARGALS